MTHQINGQNFNGERGFIKSILIVIVILLILSYYGFNLREVAESPTTQSNFSYVMEFLSYTWTHYLQGPAVWVWNEVIVKFMLEPLLHKS